MIDVCSHPRFTAAAVEALMPLSPQFVPFTDDEVEQSIVERFEKVVARFPQHVAVFAEGQSWTYQELNRRANAIAEAILERRGENPEPIAILMEKRALHYAAILGVLKAEKFYVPLAPSAPALRNMAIISRANAALLLTDEENERVAKKLMPSDSGVLAAAAIQCGDTDDTPGTHVEPGSPATIIFTSGSTGEPKGVILSHRAILHNVQNYTNDLLLQSTDRLICLGASAFSGILKDVFGALLNGAALYPVEPTQLGIGNLSTFCRRSGITVIDAVPTLFRAWVGTLNDADRFPDIRVVRLGGEPMTAVDLESFNRYFGDKCLLVNGYGPTETGTATLWVMAKGESVSSCSIPIGRECQDMEVLLLDEQGQEVEAGEIGQIAVRSRFLASGYWGRPDLTDTAFPPESREESYQLYLTGDLARRLADGCLAFAGRNDFQVKIRGNRVEIGDVESALLKAPGVREVAIVSRQNEEGDSHLVAYVVPLRESCAPKCGELREFLRSHIPLYAIPKQFIFLEALPVNPNGKVDRRALPLPCRPSTAPFNTIPPRTELERRLTTIWEELLDTRPIGVTDDFFDLGGDSLQATGLMAKIHQEFGRSLPLSVMAQSATIANLAAFMEAYRAEDTSGCLVRLQTEGNKPPFFCVHGLGGEVLFLHALAAMMRPDQPFHAFQMAGLHNDDQPLGTIEEMAARYVEEMIRFQPRGPYHVGGYSLGGTVAYEMAQQLKGRGLEVGLLVLIDQRNVHPGPGSRLTLESAAGLARNVPWWLWDDLLSTPPAKMWQRLCAKLGVLVRRVKAVFPSKADFRAQAGDVFDLSRYSERYRRLMEVNFAACRRYVPRPYPGQIVLLRARSQALLRLQGRDLGWKDFAEGGLEIRDLPGNHNTLFDEPNVRAVARELRRSMACV